MDDTLKTKCRDCGKEYNYSPVDKYSRIKSRWVKSAHFCGLECFNKQPKHKRDSITIAEMFKHHIDKIKNKKAERKLREKENEKNYL
jgi:hypothetical protein